VQSLLNTGLARIIATDNAGRRRRAADARQRTRLVKGLRRVARRAGSPAPARRFEVLLCDRAAAVRFELLDLAALLQRTRNPHPAAIATLRWLLTDGCESPLYNRDVPASRLTPALDEVRTALSGDDSRASATGLADRWADSDTPTIFD
jgi:hypothetical protein